MRNPLRSEAEAFGLLVVVVGGAVLIALAAYLDTWVGVAAAVLVVVAIGVWLKRAPGLAPVALTSSTPGSTHRVLLLAPPGTSGLAGKLDGGVTEILVVVPALASTVEALTGAVDDRRADAQQTVDALVAELSGAGPRVRGVVGADDSVLAAEDALREFGADEIVVAGGDAALLARARERFALPVSTL